MTLPERLRKAAWFKRGDGSDQLMKDAADRIEELEGIHIKWLNKWERLECEYCGSKMNPGVWDIIEVPKDPRKTSS